AVWLSNSRPLVPLREERTRMLPTMMEAAVSVVPPILAMLAVPAAAVDRAVLDLPPHGRPGRQRSGNAMRRWNRRCCRLLLAAACALVACPIMRADEPAPATAPAPLTDQS